MGKEIVSELSPEDKVVNRYLNKCFQELLSRVGLEYSFRLSPRREKEYGRYKDRINVLQKGSFRKRFLAPKKIAEIKRLPFKEKTEGLKLEINVLNLGYLEKIKDVVTEANEYHNVEIEISGEKDPSSITQEQRDNLEALLRNAKRLRELEKQENYRDNNLSYEKRY